jgi:hypothetical protein
MAFVERRRFPFGANFRCSSPDRDPTFGSLTLGVVADTLSEKFPLRQANRVVDSGVLVRLINFCYAVVGFAVARWLFRREPLPLNDPVAQLRASGLL